MCVFVRTIVCSSGCYDLAGENRASAGTGAIDALVAVMRAHVGNAGVLEQACCAMRNICEDNGAFAVCVLELTWDILHSNRSTRELTTMNRISFFEWLFQFRSLN